MLRSNTNKARENVRAYIMEGFCEEYNDNIVPDNFVEMARIILADFRRAKGCEIQRRRVPEQTIFEDWCAGLPGIIDTCYYYNRSAVDDLGEILEETAEEKARYTEEKAEKMLSYLIYSELLKWAAKEIPQADTSDIDTLTDTETLAA